MAKPKLRGMLFLGAVSGLSLMLAACEWEDGRQVQGNSLLSEAASGAGWSMTDLAGLEPALLGGNYADMPTAVPMQASWDGGYDFAPAYDYAPDTDEYYEPLDESYFAESSSSDDYLWLALATGLAGMLGDSPPDYAFGYDGVQPWAWETGDHYIRYAEPVYGGYRYYYYEPNAYRPFLVRDPYYSYGYRDDRLMVIYDRHGRIVDGGRARYQRLAAREYYSRGEHLYRAGHKHRRFGVPARLWDSHRDRIGRERREWEDARRSHANWQRWDARHQQRLHSNWASEALVRRKAERDFAKWRKADYRTPAPAFYTAENRREQLRKVAEIRREQTSGRREKQRLGYDRAQNHAQEHNRSSGQHMRSEGRGPDRARDQIRKASLAAEPESRRADRAERVKDRPIELRRAADRQQSAERVVERRRKQVAQRPSIGKKPVAERRNQQTRQAEQRRKSMQVQRADHQRKTARDAEVRRERERQPARQETRRQDRARQQAVRQARQEQVRKKTPAQTPAQAQTQTRKERQVRQNGPQRQQAERAQEQRAERQVERRQQVRQTAQRRQQAVRQQQRQGAEHPQAQRQPARHQADQRARQQTRQHARQVGQDRRRSDDR